MKKVLIVDDSKTILNVFKLKFSQYQDIETIYAENYIDAMKIIRRHNKEIDVALLDVSLPDAPNGEIISLATANNLPTIVLTGTLNQKIREKIQNKHIISYILKNKPSSIDLAIKAVLSTLENKNKTVLIVDDSPVSRKSLRKILEKMNLNVIETGNAYDALDILKDTKVEISIVITDYEMPQMNGLDLTIKIREMYNKDTLGILAISSLNNKNLIDDFLTFGANDFMNKDFIASEIIAKINAMLELFDLFKQIRDIANKDYMTGAYNRRYFFNSGNAIFLKAKRKKSSIAIAMLDIDKFKNINDTYGHDIGDIAIKEVKRILDATLRSSDLMARFGGEEFCILLEDISLEDTKKLFEKIKQKFEDNIINVNDTKIKYTVSFGIAYGMPNSLDDMIKLSDDALYHSKENGRNQITVKENPID
ncbi:MAG: diguanylate cyclase (GGDEF)-like protein [Sulfurimonas sp.]|jgi:diguanylate cyclase (GGDEF)-like protein|uniref:GGDEF domain-containing response regulator n=1 Tax=Sulfurimonas sp. TaxID=2022749 RepID=UPI0039E354AC